MKQSLFIILFVLIFALTVVAEPRFRKGGRGGRSKSSANAAAAATATASASASVSASASAAATTTTGGSIAATNTTSSAAAAATTETGNNANFNSISLDGQPSGQACDISKFPPTNGQQLKTAGANSCTNTQMGELPDVDHMVAAIVLNPQNGQTIPANQPFTVAVKTQGMNLGFFDDPATQYYLFSQQLDTNGFIMGHQHVTIQKIIDPTQPLDPKSFAFFKGLNNIDQNGVLTVNVTSGLAAGDYRLCTMTGSFGHQPVIMPVAQRGAQDDCIRFSCA